MRLLEEREERTRRRKEDKKRHDSEIALSYDEETKRGIAKLNAKSVKELSDTTARLLDEGAVEGNGWIDCFIKKGTIEKFMNGENRYLENLDDDFEGHVNLGHIDFATFPYIIGSWKKEDLHIVDIDNGRKALDVDLHLDKDSIFVQELARQPYDIGISAEFYYHLDWDATMDLGFEVIDEIYIKAYGLVGECGNVNSDGLELKGTEDMKEPEKEMKVKEASEPTEAEEALEVGEAEESVDSTAENIETEQVEEAESEVEEADEAEGDEGEEAEETDGEEGEEEESLDLDEEEINLSVAFDEMNKQIEELKKECVALKKQNKKLSKRLATKNEEIEKFTSKFKGLSVSLGLKKEEKKEVAPKEEAEHRLYAGSDGIGE